MLKHFSGFSQEKGNRVEDGIVTYMSVLPYLSSLESLSSASPQLKYWTEWLLSRLCLLSDQSQRSGAYLDPDQALRVFRIWGKLFEVKPGLTRSTASAGTSTTITSRGRVWKAYYDTLSAILQHDVAYSLSSNTIGPYSTENEKENGNIRLQQRAELKRVETLYEAQLLEETQFPKASQSNADIEIWVDSVIDNWRVLCGPRWQDEDLGEGGKAAVGHEVLDVSNCGLFVSKIYFPPNAFDRFFTEPPPRLSTRPRFFDICSPFTHLWQNSILHSKLSTPTWKLSREGKLVRSRAERRISGSTMTTLCLEQQQKRFAFCVDSGI